MPVLATLTGENQFTSPLGLGFQTQGGVGFDLTIRGTFVGTLTLQFSYDRALTWWDIKTYQAPDAEIGEQFEVHVLVRIGFKTGDYTSGSATVRLGSGVVEVL